MCSCIKFTTISVNSKLSIGKMILVFKTDWSWVFLHQLRKSLIEWKLSLWRREKLWPQKVNTHETWLLKVDRDGWRSLWVIGRKVNWRNFIELFSVIPEAGSSLIYGISLRPPLGSYRLNSGIKKLSLKS